MKKVLCLLLCLLVTTGCATNKEESKEVKEENTVQEEVKVEEKVEVPAFTIKICDKEVTEKTMEGYEIVSYEVDLVNSKGTEKHYKYEGYRITDVLKAIGIDVKEGLITATATDGYETVYKENFILDDTLIAVLRDGEAFEEGPWLAPCSSTTNGDYLKNISEIMIAVN